jgi:branched-chain amino acid transport system permease protein
MRSPSQTIIPAWRRASSALASPPDAKGGTFAQAVGDAAVSALVSLGIFGAMLGLRMQETGSGLILAPRAGLLGFAILVVFVGRLTMGIVRGRWPAGRLPFAVDHPAARRLGAWSQPILLGGAVVLPFLPGVQRYHVDLCTVILTYMVLGWGLNIVVGLAGLLDLGYVAFYAIGAYSFALLSTHFGWSFWLCLPLAGILAAAWGVVLGFPVLRLRGDYLAIVTLAFGEIIRVVLNNWTDVSNGPSGISDIPRPTLFGLTFDVAGGPGTFAGALGIEPSVLQRMIFLYYIILALAVLTNLVATRLRRLPIGRAWEALREDEMACRSLGMNVTKTKLAAFATGAAFGGFAGAFFATRQGFISPESFTFRESSLVLSIVVLGGMGSQAGIMWAAIVMIGAGEALRGFAQYRMLLFGLALVIVMVIRPRGLISSRTRTISL